MKFKRTGCMVVGRKSKAIIASVTLDEKKKSKGKGNQNKYRQRDPR